MVAVLREFTFRYVNTWAFAWASLIFYIAWISFYYYFSYQFMQDESPLIICRANCRSFLILAEHLIEHGEFGGQDIGSKAALPMYRGFVVFLAAVKLVFGSAWEYGYTLSLTLWYALFCLTLAWVMAPADQRPLALVLSLMLAAGSIRLLIYIKFLVADFFFAFGVGTILLLTVLSVVRGSIRLQLIALALAVLWCFVKPQGSLLLAAVAGTLAFDGLGRLIGRRWLRFAGAPIAGLAVVLVAVSISAYGASRLEAVGSLPDSTRQLVMIFMEINVLGEDYITTFEDRLGAQVLMGHGYRVYSMHDGSWGSLMLAILHRVPASASELAFGFTRSCAPVQGFCEVYRPALQFLMYGAFLVYAFMAFRWRERDPRHLLFVSLSVGYYLAFIGMSLVIIRYLLPFDAMFTVATVGVLLAALDGRLKMRPAAGRGVTAGDQAPGPGGDASDTVRQS